MVHVSSVSQGYFTMEQVCTQPSRLKELKYFILRVVVAKMLKPLFHFPFTLIRNMPKKQVQNEKIFTVNLRDPFLLSGINLTISIMMVLINSNSILVRQLQLLLNRITWTTEENIPTMEKSRKSN